MAIQKLTIIMRTNRTVNNLRSPGRLVWFESKRGEFFVGRFIGEDDWDEWVVLFELELEE